MPEPVELELTAAKASAHVAGELSLAEAALQEGKTDEALDGYVRALGLAVQLGPASTGHAVRCVLLAAHELAKGQDAAGLSALAPALVGLVDQMREAEAIPGTAVMDAWARFIEGLGAMIGQVGLALALPSGHQSGMMASARSHASLLDEATDEQFSLVAWLDEVSA
jgi:hypothetical protein